MDGISPNHFEYEYAILSSVWEYVWRECDTLLNYVQNDAAIFAEKKGPLKDRLLRDLDRIGEGGRASVDI